MDMTGNSVYVQGSPTVDIAKASGLRGEGGDERGASLPRRTAYFPGRSDSFYASMYLGSSINMQSSTMINFPARA